MRIKHFILTMTVLLSIMQVTLAQDALFSQLHNSRNLLNPSLLALQNSPLEIDLNFREQGGSSYSGLPIRTFQVLANYSHESFKVDRISYGISVFNDTGGTGHIGSSMAHLHFSYLKKLTGPYSKVGEHYLAIGTSLGGGQRSVDADRFWFGNQFNEEFNFIEEAKDPNEDILLSNASARTSLIPDLSAGISWYANLTEGLSANAGLSMFHINQSNFSLIQGGNERQKIRYVVHTSMRKNVSEVVAILPKIQYIQHGSSKQLIFGTEVSMDNNDDYEFVIRVGMFGRTVSNFNGLGMESIMFTLNAQYNQFLFGFGYDLTVSSLSKYNDGRGAWEFKVGYALDRSDKSGFRRAEKKFRL